MPLPFAVPLAVGLGSKLLGGLFNRGNANKAETADLKNQQGMLDYQAALKDREDQENEQRRTLRGSMFKGLASAFGLGNLVPTGYTDFSTTARAGVKPPRLSATGGRSSLLGDIFEGAGSALISGHMQDKYEDAFNQGKAKGYLDMRTPAGGYELGGQPATEMTLPGFSDGGEGGLSLPASNPYSNFGAYDDEEGGYGG